MTNEPTPIVGVVAATNDEMRTALQLVLRLEWEGHSDYLDSLEKEIVQLPVGSLDRPLVIRQANRLVGVVWSQRLLPNVYAVWNPYAKDSSIERRLFQSLQHRLKQPHIRLARVVLSIEDKRSAEQFRSIDFQDVTTIDSFAWTVSKVDLLASDRLQLEEVEESNGNFSDRMVRVMQATYRESLDCPELAEVLSAHEVLNGYWRGHGSGVQHWFLVRFREDDVGCLMLNLDEDEQQLSLSYLGIVPEHRGKGFGAELVTHVQRLSHQFRCRRVILSVDSNNSPAVRIYQRAGFSCFHRQLLMAQFAS